MIWLGTSLPSVESGAEEYSQSAQATKDGLEEKAACTRVEIHQSHRGVIVLACRLLEADAATLGKTEWDGLADWWLQEVEADPAYRDVVAPLAMALLGTCERRYILDVGCGDGRLMSPISAIGATPIGIDIDWSLLTNARRFGPTVRAELPDLPFADSSLGGAVVSLVLEHLPGHRPLLDELARVLEPGATLALVINHPMFTAPDSAPIADIDGETLWRPGRYFDAGFTEEPAGSGTIRFYHRTTGDLLTAAADAGFCLEQMIELGPDESQIERVPALAHQRHVPRLLGVRWRKASGHS